MSQVNNTGHEAGHKFLARLGKTRLRPGGKKATEWLLASSALGPNKKVLEVACNMGTTSMGIAERFGCRVIGIDMDKVALRKAQQAIGARGLSDLVTVLVADASKLPFENEAFDVVINEAMLTMYADKAKRHLLEEYLRVLKPGGVLLTHDIMLQDPSGAEEVVGRMRKAINVNAQPLGLQQWLGLFEQAGFRDIQYNSGEMTLLSPRGLIYDEGLLGALRIVRNALKRENRKQFLRMFKTFRSNRDQLRYIAVRAVK
ncbi:Glycine/sarcosine/dimethylglycine N-methyltransferase [Cedecea lapagei]|uniref:Glycine/sarcosine/dimethylglycine N-methyltransferase n=1 Tax=Cedecea lapagei TaxID=158823 RepID=A0A3S4IEZ8_9ENTR|nr:class I SAM-dependent methyltransferase [Cedecea lapagei]VEB98716.1 Glycine/sarcosine/dimethylglycine N-methyltransferase [Cedecea lapagei]